MFIEAITKKKMKFEVQSALKILSLLSPEYFEVYETL